MSAGVRYGNRVFPYMNAFTHPQPANPTAMPTHWPPKPESRLGDHLRRHLAVYVLGGIVAILAGISVVLVVVQELRQEVGAAHRQFLAATKER